MFFFQGQNGQFNIVAVSWFQKLNKNLLGQYSNLNSIGRERVYRD